MKAAFKLGSTVRFKGSGALAHLTAVAKDNQGAYIGGRGWDRNPELTHYIGEGFYHVTCVQDHSNLIVHEDDIELAEEFLNADEPEV